jgi:acetyltransferase-like isoleucine patch superfamily enzyme
MRKIDKKPIILFSIMFIPTTLSAIFLSGYFCGFLSLASYRPIATILISIFLIYALNIATLRLFLWQRPLIEGFYKEGSPEEFTYSVYVMFYLFLLNTLTPSMLIPIPLMRIIYICLGARLGKNSYSSGVIFDPSMIQIGNNTILGFDSVLCPHAIEGNKIFYGKIIIGHNVTVGMRAMILADCIIEDNAIVAAGSLVKKGTHIKAGETWGGIPAKLLPTKIITAEETIVNSKQSIKFAS